MSIKPGVYRKKPVTVNAVQFNNGEYTKREWLEIVPDANIGAPMARDADGKLIEDSDLDSTDFKWFVIPTLEGDHDVTDGDFVIIGVVDEKYPCKPDIFDKTYDKVTNREEQLAHDAVRAVRQAR